MSTRLRNGLAVLIAFFVFGASSQAAVCELACALQTEQSACHSGQTSEAMGMAGMDCGGPMKMSPTQAGAFSVESSCDGSCNHLHTLVLAGNSASGIHIADLQWTVVDVKRVEPVLVVRGPIASEGPPLRMSATNPLLVSLRV